MIFAFTFGLCLLHYAILMESNRKSTTPNKILNNDKSDEENPSDVDRNFRNIAKRDTNSVETESSINVTFVDTEDGHNITYTREQILEEIRLYIYPTVWMWVLICFHCIVFVVGLVGNTLVCVAVYRNHTMRTVTNYFIVNLAFADFLVILFCLPPSVVWDVTSTWFFGVAMCKVVLYLQVSSFWHYILLFYKLLF